MRERYYEVWGAIHHDTGRIEPLHMGIEARTAEEAKRKADRHWKEKLNSVVKTVISDTQPLT